MMIMMIMVILMISMTMMTIMIMILSMLGPTGDNEDTDIAVTGIDVYVSTGFHLGGWWGKSPQFNNPPENNRMFLPENNCVLESISLDKICF